MKYCLDCGSVKSLKGNYCKVCGYKHRKRPSGLQYKIVRTNKSWFKKGHSLNVNRTLSEETKIKISKSRKGMRSSINTEFKYTNGNGYRHLLLKGILPQCCQECGEDNLKRLHVHHLDLNRKNNDISNLLVLCRPHHLERHNRKEKVYVEGRSAVYA